MEQEKKAGPARLFDVLKAENKLKNDAALARAIGMPAAVICNMRAGRVEISAPAILRIIENFGMPLPRIRRLLKGDE